jgi:transaldolase
MTNPLANATANGVSIWLDDLSRERIESGNLKHLIDNYSVRGVTTNPSIFAAALKDPFYSKALAEEAALGHDALESIGNITSTDVSAACVIFR